MVWTRSQAMDRSALEKLTLEQLRAEARRYGLSASGTKETVLEAILAHLLATGPVEELQSAMRAASGSGGPTEASGTAPHRRGSQGETLSQMMMALQGIMKRQDEERQEQRRFQQQQQQQLAQLLEALTRRMEDPTRTEPREQGPSGSARSSPTEDSLRATTGLATGTTVQTLASQMPEFTGGEEDNVVAWIRRVDKVAQVHGASDGATLLAASSKLSGPARRWYDVQGDEVLESWTGLRTEMLKIYDRKIPFHKIMQKIEARKWLTGKETFDEYVIDKLLLLHRVDLTVADKIYLLISGITQSSLRATALSISAKSIEEFLEKMRNITQGIGDYEKKSSPTTPRKNKESACKNCGKKGHEHKACKNELTCFYCKEKGHRKFDCPLLKAKDKKTAPKAPASAAASVTPVDLQSEEVATVEDSHKRLVVDDPFVEVCQLNGEPVKLIALIDTGSPVSFIKNGVFDKHIKANCNQLRKSDKKLRNLSNQALNILGVIRANIVLRRMENLNFSVEFHILKSNSFQGDFIIGRDFLGKEKLTFVYEPSAQGEQDKVNLFTCLPLYVDEGKSSELEQILRDKDIDFNVEYKDRLIQSIMEIEKQKNIPIDDGYSVQVHLRDSSIYAYAPRRFAHIERMQIREITDDLLNRGIIQPSISPYCARVIPVKKKDGRIRLCIDLRPLNSRVIKQKYPFPIIEECLTRLHGKKIFTSLDLKDSFHQITVHKDSTKYFSFATPDGQFEFRKLPFGYCEAPAEFQKRLIQILNPLIRADKVIVYIDDILIASDTVDQNITLIKVLTIIKKYDFDLNYAKCIFLKKKIKFLGYIVTVDGITLSPRHTDALRHYKRPKDKCQLQRFLGLTNYFRKFIKDYAVKIHPLQRMLKKSVEYNFDAECEKSFNLLKDELTSYPLLRLYDPAAETQLHTDASSIGIGAILLQKSQKGTWGPVAYFSRATNSAENKYHSYELEMLAIVKAIERFYIYLYGIIFTVVTDCNALVYAINKANLNPRIARWTLALQNYIFNITHRPGTRMAHVDALSRSVAYVNELPLERELEYRQLADPQILKISRELEFNDSDKFKLINGLVYKITEGRDKFVVPDTMIQRLTGLPR